MAFPPYGTTVPTLSSWQVSYSGVTVGAGTAYGILGATGIGDLPAVNTGDIARPRDQGELRGLDFIGGRDLTLDLQIWTPGSGSNLQALQSTLAGVTNPNSQTTETPLWIQLPNLPLLASMKAEPQLAEQLERGGLRLRRRSPLATAARRGGRGHGSLGEDGHAGQ